MSSFKFQILLVVAVFLALLVAPLDGAGLVPGQPPDVPADEPGEPPVGWPGIVVPGQPPELCELCELIGW